MAIPTMKVIADMRMNGADGWIREEYFAIHGAAVPPKGASVNIKPFAFARIVVGYISAVQTYFEVNAIDSKNLPATPIVVRRGFPYLFMGINAITKI